MKFLAQLFLIASGVSGFAFGTKPAPEEADVTTVASALRANPYADVSRQQLAQFQAGTLGGNLNPAIRLNFTYKCIRFLAVTQAELPTAVHEKVSYEFVSVDGKTLRNLASENKDPFDIPEYLSANPVSASELVGINDATGYREAIRVSPKGDLIIEGFAEDLLWARFAQRALGLALSLNYEEALKKLSALAPTSLTNPSAKALFYASCAGQ